MGLGFGDNRDRFNAARVGIFSRAEEKTNEKVAPSGKLRISGRRGASAVSLCKSGRSCIALGRDQRLGLGQLRAFHIRELFGSSNDRPGTAASKDRRS